MIQASQLITEYRRTAGLSQSQLAALLTDNGCPTTNKVISTWEKGSAVPNANQFLAIKEVLHIAEPSIRDLTIEGRYKVYDYINTLLLVDKYRAIKRTLPYYDVGISAGTGQYIEDVTPTMIEVSDSVPETADYGVHIVGDSMEPRIPDQSIIWIQTTIELRIGDIGVFWLDGETYCKVLGNNELISINTKYAPISITEATSFKVLGKVVD